MYILSAQRDDEEIGRNAFARYAAYLAAVSGEMPTGAYALASASWYFDFRHHGSPHDGWLEQATVAETPAAGGRRATSITLRLLGAFHDGHVELRYRDVSRYRMELQPGCEERGRGHRDWRYDELRLAPGGRVEHEIEWWGLGPTGTWLIEAADVEYRWTASAPGAPDGFRVP
jgi:hypothetical protein